jgi:hypothetical protein
MYRRVLSTVLTRKFAYGISVLFLVQIAAAQLPQFVPDPMVIADPRDTRFQSVKEDWSTPALSSSRLKAVQPVIMDISYHPEQYTVQLIQLQWRFGDPIDLYVMKPAGAKKPPAILYLYSYPSQTDIFKSEDWQRAAIKDGFAAVGFLTALTGHRYHNRGMNEWFVSELQESLAVSAHDVQMVMNYLAQRGDLDMDRVGIAAEGSGASVAILASAVDDRIKALDVLNPWGDWPTWMAKSPFVPEEERSSYVKSEYLKKVAVLDPLDWLPKIQAKQFRLQDAVFDLETPVEIHAKLLRALPVGATIVTYNTRKEYVAAVTDNKQMGWMYRELRALPDPAAAIAADHGGSPTCGSRCNSH